jgi:hypothetical protein
VNALATLQREFQDFVLVGTDAIRPRIDEGLGPDPATRLAIYRDGYRLRLLEALATDYWALKAVIGNDPFDALCLAYVEATPSTFRNLRWYGASVAEFLRAAAPWSSEPWLSELARFEWALGVAFDSADHPVATFEAFAVLPPDAWATLTLQASGSVQLLDLRTNAPLVRKALDAELEPPAFEIQPEPITWLVWRQVHSVRYRSLSKAEGWALGALTQGASFPAICEGVCQWLSPDEAGPHAAGWLRDWVDSGVIAGVSWEAAELL